MDFGTLRKKLEHNDYMYAKECIEDYRLIFNNCYNYNKPGEVSSPKVTVAILRYNFLN